MLFQRLKLSGLLSFGPRGIDLPMQPLNILIGPNGSGKSNFLEALSLFRAAPNGIGEPISRTGGIREWLWKGSEAPEAIIMEADVVDKLGSKRHHLELVDSDGRPKVKVERLEQLGLTTSGVVGSRSYFRPPQDKQVASKMERIAIDRIFSVTTELDKSLNEMRDMIHKRPEAVEIYGGLRPEESILSILTGHENMEIWFLRERYMNIWFYRNWSMGPNAKQRQPCDAHGRSDFLLENGENLPLVLSHLRGERKRTFLDYLGKLFEGIVDINCPVTSGMVSLFLEETGDRSIPASRLSDGTLRYLCLLAVLLHPYAPPLIVIEEPELGLHPDLLPTLADLMVDASRRSQIVVTIHSDVLVDALTEHPESIVICEKHDGETQMRRLDEADLKKWLSDYRLGELWTSGELGGNRW